MIFKDDKIECCQILMSKPNVVDVSESNGFIKLMATGEFWKSVPSFSLSFFNSSHAGLSEDHFIDVYFQPWTNKIKTIGTEDVYVELREISKSLPNGEWELFGIESLGTGPAFKISRSVEEIDDNQIVSGWSTEQITQLSAIGIEHESMAFSVIGESDQFSPDDLLPSFNSIQLSHDEVKINPDENGYLWVESDIGDIPIQGEATLIFKNSNDPFDAEISATINPKGNWGDVETSSNNLSLIHLPSYTPSGQWELHSAEFNAGLTEESLSLVKDGSSWSEDDIAILDDIGINPSELSFQVLNESSLPGFESIELNHQFFDLKNDPGIVVLDIDLGAINLLAGNSQLAFVFSNSSSESEDLHFFFSDWSTGIADGSIRQIGTQILPEDTVSGTWELSRVNFSTFPPSPIGLSGGLTSGFTSSISRFTESSYGYSNELEPWSQQELNALNALGIDPSNLSFTVSGNDEASEELELNELFSELSLEVVEISDLDKRPSRTLRISDNNPNQAINVDIEVSHDEGLHLNQSYGSLTISGPDNASSNFINVDESKGSEISTFFTSTFDLDPKETPSGTYAFGDLYLWGPNGGFDIPSSVSVNEFDSSFLGSDLTKSVKTHVLSEALGMNTDDLRFEVINTSQGGDYPDDTSGPELINFTLLTQEVDISAVNATPTVTIEFDARDDISGFSAATFHFYHQSGDSLVIPANISQLIDGNSNEGTYRSSSQFWDYAPEGKYTLSYVELIDNQGNRFNTPKILLPSVSTNSADSSNQHLEEGKVEKLASMLNIDSNDMKIDFIKPNQASSLENAAAPVVVDVRVINGDVDVSDGDQTLKVQLDLELGDSNLADWGSSITFAGPGRAETSNATITKYISNADLIRTDDNGLETYEVSIDIDEKIVSGRWQLSSFSIASTTGLVARAPNSLQLSYSDRWFLDDQQLDTMAALYGDAFGFSPELLRFDVSGGTEPNLSPDSFSEYIPTPILKSVDFNFNIPFTPFILPVEVPETVREGETFQVKLDAHNIDVGEEIYWKVFGETIDSEDVLGELDGATSVAEDRSIAINPSLANDKQTEGHETLKVQFFSDTAFAEPLSETLDISILDTSTATPVQAVYTPQNDIKYDASMPLEMPIWYTTNTGNNNLEGLSFNIHFDSSILTPISNAGVSSQLPSDHYSAVVLLDENNIDNDNSTDSLIRLDWISEGNSFPNTELPVEIAQLSFNTSAQTTDITGEELQTKLHFTSDQTASGYEFESESTTLTAFNFNLDVDGDGEVRALTDGLMIVRKLFGAAFTGDNLTDNARGDTSSRNTAEIHDFIQAGIKSLALDVDNDGQVTALGDGLMIIRRLFGAAFSGSALTNQAISHDSDFYGQTDAWESVANNIDALRPDL